MVGGGISGLAAAWFYRRAAGPSARILVLDNHDDFGGHAKRNELTLDGRLLIGYGGSESIDSPQANYSDVAKALLRELGVEIARFETAFERTLYPSLGLARGLFFAREAFGRDVLVAGEPPMRGTDEVTRRLANAKPLAEFVAAFPISDASKAQLLALHDGARDPLAGKTIEEKLAILKPPATAIISRRSAAAARRWRTASRAARSASSGSAATRCRPPRRASWAIRASRASACRAGRWRGAGALHLSFPRRQRLARPPAGARARPGVAPGRDMDDVVLAAFDYGKLDREGQSVRIRLDSTCIDVRDSGDKVVLGYVRASVPHRIEARHAVLACFHTVIPHIMPELPAPQRDALAQNVKTPLVYTNVLVRDWRPWVRLGVHDVFAPMSFHSRVKLDFPVSLGGYRHSRDPSEPICLHLAHVPGAPNRGLDARAQFRIGQGKLLAMTFADFEARIRDDLDRMLGPGGFSSARDIAAITVNRWPHGYGYVRELAVRPRRL